MTIRLATWNVNSVRQRLDHLAAFCRDQRPDILCLQETKVANDLFPLQALRDLGFAHFVINGQKGYNGIAIAARVPVAEQDCWHWCRKDDSRHGYLRLSSGLEVHNFYVPSGGDLPDPKQNPSFAHKLRFLREMAQWCRRDQVKARKVVILGDLNVAPLETDVWNHKRLVRNVGHTPVESELMGKLLKAGAFVDAERHFVPPSEPLYTWWGYRFPQSVAKDYGWRLDHVWVTEPLAPRLAAMTVAKQTRLWERPSDHVPVVVDLN